MNSIQEFCEEFFVGGSKYSDPIVSKMIISSAIQSSMAKLYEDTWIECIFEDGRFGMVYDGKVPSESSWFLVWRKEDGSFDSRSGRFTEENLKWVHQYATMEG
jgi:hypothetical protein